MARRPVASSWSPPVDALFRPGFGMSAGAAVATAGPRRERSGKARTAGEGGLACGPEGRLEDV